MSIPNLHLLSEQLKSRTKANALHTSKISAGEKGATATSATATITPAANFDRAIQKFSRDYRDRIASVGSALEAILQFDLQQSLFRDDALLSQLKQKLEHAPLPASIAYFDGGVDFVATAILNLAIAPVGSKRFVGLAIHADAHCLPPYDTSHKLLCAMPELQPIRLEKLSYTSKTEPFAESVLEAISILERSLYDVEVIIADLLASTLDSTSG